METSSKLAEPNTVINTKSKVGHFKKNKLVIYVI